ncbi:hypothetical protein EST92_11745 [Streptomyces sp. TM32]|uniref:hypothetical protein n=1 Tax=Streptomyces sp. TM32 TaxID=1652669 RepID=UPI001011EB6C|nr:hypothetical protein [Streptomyces sp. TM32]RXS84224.1 hypothetical protein EST92_11745 [Streptomyces sp. TM32]
MNRNGLRIAAATAMAGVAFGVVAPAANAVEAHRAVAAAPVVSAAELAAMKAANPASATNGEAGITPQQLAEMTALAKAAGAQPDERASSLAGGKLGSLINLLKKSPGLLKAAVKAAKGGARAFEQWTNSLSNWNPVKWAIKSAPDYIIYQLIDYLVNM